MLRTVLCGVESTRPARKQLARTRHNQKVLVSKGLRHEELRIVGLVIPIFMLAGLELKIS